MDRALDALEADPPHHAIDIGSITIGCALGYLDFRFAAQPWRPGHPMLTAWYQRLCAEPRYRRHGAEGPCLIDLRDASAPAEAVIEAPICGHIPRADTIANLARCAGGWTRGAGTAILFLLRDGERSHWHRVDAAELWMWQGGRRCCCALAPLEPGLVRR